MATTCPSGQDITAQALRYTPRGPSQIEKFKEQPLNNYEKLILGVACRRGIESETAVEAVDRAFYATSNQTSTNAVRAQTERAKGIEPQGASRCSASEIDDFLSLVLE